MRVNSTHNETVRFIRFNEPANIQIATIQNLQSSLGAETSRDVVERAAFEVSDRLDRLEFALMQGDLKTTAKIASGLILISQQIGLEKFAAIAENLVQAVENQDFVATAAISNRLIRQGENALFDAVSFHDNPAYS